MESVDPVCIAREPTIDSKTDKTGAKASAFSLCDIVARRDRSSPCKDHTHSFECAQIGARIAVDQHDVRRPSWRERAAFALKPKRGTSAGRGAHQHVFGTHPQFMHQLKFVREQIMVVERRARIGSCGTLSFVNQSGIVEVPVRPRYGIS